MCAFVLVLLFCSASIEMEFLRFRRAISNNYINRFDVSAAICVATPCGLAKLSGPFNVCSRVQANGIYMRMNECSASIAG